MPQCDHVAWLELVEGNAGPHLSYGWRLARVVHEMHAAAEQFPQIILLLGRSQKNAALPQLCKSKYRTSNRPQAVNLRLDRASVRSSHPRLFADWDPGRRDVQPAFDSPKVCHREEDTQVNWPSSTSWKPHDLVLARLILLFCDVICIFSDDVGGIEATVSLLMTWANIGSASSLPRRIRPRVIVVTKSVSATEKILAEDDLLFSIRRAENASTFFSSFVDVKISNLPSDELSPEARYLQLSTELLLELHDARRARETSRLMFSATHLNALFEDALRHTAQDILAPFDFIHSSRRGNPLDGSFVSHLSAFLRQGIRMHIAYEGLASYVASAILVDAYPPLMHEFSPRAVFRTLYRTAVYSALRRAYKNDAFAKSQCQSVENHLEELFNVMIQSRETSSQIHRYNLTHRKESWKLIKLNVTCSWCLRRCRGESLPCGHAICDVCTQRYGEAFEAAEYEFAINECICCKDPVCIKIRIKPPTAGARIISIDGGGIRGIVPLEMLTMMQDVLGPDLPVLCLADFFTGTSSGGIIALNMGKCQHGVKASKEAFYHLVKEFFQRPKYHTTKLGRLFETWSSDGRYDAGNLENMMIGHYGTLRMLGTPPTKISGWKVAAISSTINNGSPVLFTNYNSETPPGRDRGYGYVQTETEDGPFVWQALLPSIDIAGVSYQDGGVRPQNNNPVLLGLSEVRRLWPATPTPDVVVSLGTCSEPEHSPTASRFRNVLVDGMFSRGYRSISSSYDGEDSWKQLKGLLLETRAEKNYIRLNVPFPPGRRPSMDNAGAMDTLAQWVRKQSLEIEQASVSLLLSSFFFVLDGKPEFQSGLFHCIGSIRCRAPARAVIRLLSSLHPTRIDFYKDDMNLGLPLSEEDICESCGRYRRPAQFFVRHLKEEITLSVRYEGIQQLLSQFPKTMQSVVDEQGLDCSFGLANHGIPFRIQCSACEGQGRRKKKKLRSGTIWI
ncbi:hypothetical protein ACJ73_03090 [Blastomyces percursus]|uniref:PNPLA domain-containing protein n=1 Tax=Blastomyces percursus TaxID=1658174 RepID=A0A1J9QAH7_9EURO|nr:hypothetical protein ACJ73_03090 [Blastomyces percursus]